MKESNGSASRGRGAGGGTVVLYVRRRQAVWPGIRGDGKVSPMDEQQMPPHATSPAHRAASGTSMPAAVSATSAASAHRSTLLIVFLVVFIDLLGFGIVLPLLPRIANDYVNHLLNLPTIQQEPEGLSGLIIGLLMASFSIMQFLFAPMWGRVSDRLGRRQ
ncbi:MAG: MFS transporter, partial [Gemmataceae bacterium]|nr:MFS transporter [Gemmataceae bacterium]